MLIFVPCLSGFASCSSLAAFASAFRDLVLMLIKVLVGDPDVHLVPPRPLVALVAADEHAPVGLAGVQQGADAVVLEIAKPETDLFDAIRCLLCLDTSPARDVAYLMNSHTERRTQASNSSR